MTDCLCSVEKQQGTEARVYELFLGRRVELFRMKLPCMQTDGISSTELGLFHSIGQGLGSALRAGREFCEWKLWGITDETSY